MSDAHKELREAVARAIKSTIRHAIEPDARANQMTPDELSMVADAAIAVVLEEAAKVADRNAAEAWAEGAEETRGLMRMQAADIAAAIRAMKEG